MELQQHLQEKETHRKTRRNNALHKQREKLKYLSLHKGKIHWEYTEETLKEGFTFTYLWIRT